MSKKEQIKDLARMITWLRKDLEALKAEVSDLQLENQALRHDMETLIERLEEKVAPKKRWPETSPPWFSRLGMSVDVKQPQYKDLFHPKSDAWG